MWASTTDINEYLVYEFGMEDLGSNIPNESWPFELDNLGSIDTAEEKIAVYAFIGEGEGFFALDGRALSFLQDGNQYFTISLYMDGHSLFYPKMARHLKRSVSSCLVRSGSARRIRSIYEPYRSVISKYRRSKSVMRLSNSALTGSNKTHPGGGS